MKKYLLTLLILLTSLILTGCFGTSKTQEQGTWPEESEVQTDSWFRYSNDNLKLEFRHPAGWQTISEESEGASSTIFISQKDCYYFIGQELDKGCYLFGVSMVESKEPLIPLRQDKKYNKFPGEIKTVKELEVDGLKESLEMSENYFLLQSKRAGFIYIFSGNFSPGDEEVTKGILEKVFGSMVID